jgi:hypothetical protein
MKILESKKEEIKKLIWEGKSYKEISKIYNVNPETVARLVRFYKFTRLNKDYFDIINTEAKAYILGFIFADGSIYRSKSKNSYCLEIGLHKKDVDVIKLIRDEISPSQKIYYKKDACILNIASKYLCESLLHGFNLKLNKSHEIYLNFNINKIPIELQRHFIRGFFDGDGHVGTTNSKYFLKRKNTLREKIKVCRFGFTSSHVLFLDYLINVFTPMGFKSRLYNRDKYTNNLHFNLNKKNIKVIYNFFYENSNYFLLRKKISFEIGLNNTEVSS